MKKCPYCFEILTEELKHCSFCNQFIIDPVIDVDYKSIEKKKCVFCGKKVFKEARICKHCHQWLDKVVDAENTYDNID